MRKNIFFEKNLQKKSFFEKIFYKTNSRKNFLLKKSFPKKISTDIGWSKFKRVEVGRKWNFSYYNGLKWGGLVYKHLPSKRTGP